LYGEKPVLKTLVTKEVKRKLKIADISGP